MGVRNSRTCAAAAGCRIRAAAPSARGRSGAGAGCVSVCRGSRVRMAAGSGVATATRAATRPVARVVRPCGEVGAVRRRCRGIIASTDRSERRGYRAGIRSVVGSNVGSGGRGRPIASALSHRGRWVSRSCSQGPVSGPVCDLIRLVGAMGLAEIPTAAAPASRCRPQWPHSPIRRRRR